MAQGNLAAAHGLFLGFLKNADFTLNALITLLPHVLTLLPYAVMAMVEEFTGGEADRKRARSDAEERLLRARCQCHVLSGWKSGTCTTRPRGFLDDVSIEQQGKDGKP